MTQLTVGRVTQSDHDEVSELARRVHEEGVFAEIPFSPKKFSRYFMNTIDEPSNHLGLKVTKSDKIVGFSYCYAGGYYIGDGARIVTVNTINVDQSIRNTMLGGKASILIAKGIKRWAIDQRANAILYHVTSGRNLSSIDRFFRKMGMTTLGGNYGVRL